MSEFHVVRSSERAAKRRCRRAWDLGWRQRWTPYVGPQAMEFGIGIHAGMQAIYEPSRWDSTTPSQKLLHALKAFRETCDEQSTAYLKHVGQRRTTWDGRDDYLGRVELGEKMLEYYVLNVHPVQDVGLRPTKVEVKFQVPVLEEDGSPVRCWNSPACGQSHEDGAEVVHEGRIDVLFEDTIRGGYYPGDWKTVGGYRAVDGDERNTNRWSDPAFVPVHDQLCTYSAALGHVLKRDIRGFILAEIRKDYPKLPALLTKKRNGGLYSTNKNQSTNLEIFKSWVCEHDIDGVELGAYDEYLGFLAGDEAPQFHKRFRVQKTPAQLEIIWANVVREVKAMTAKDVEIFPEANQFTCRGCSFRGPCDMMMQGLDYEYTLNSGYQQSELEV